MSVSEFDPDQQQTDHRLQQKEEPFQRRHHHQGLVPQQSQKLENQSSIDHMVDKQRLHAELDGHLHSQVNSNRCDLVSQAAIDHNSHAAPASPESARLEAVNEQPDVTQKAGLVRSRFLGEIPGATNLDAIRRACMKISGSPNRVCRICYKKFSSGRALGGHMRVHGPLFTQGSASRNEGLAADCTQKQGGGNTGCEDDQEETTSIIDAFEDESDKEPAQHARSEQASLSSVGDGNGKLSCIDSYGVDEFSMYGRERRLASFTGNTEFAGYGEEVVASATSADKKSLLYELRRNPKRSRWFAEQDFTVGAQQAFMNFSMPNSVSAEGARVVCSECGKAFCSERALFGHMRCHPEREWRGVLPPESSLEQRAGAMAKYCRKRALEGFKAMENSELKIKANIESGIVAAAELQGVSAGNSPITGAAAPKTRDMDDEHGHEAEFLQGKVGDKELHECTSIGEISEININRAPRWRSAGRRSRRRLVNKAGNEETSSEEPTLTSSESMHDSLELALEPELSSPDCLMLLAEAARKIEEGANLQNFQSQLGIDEYAHAHGFSLKELKSGHQADRVCSSFDAGEHDNDAADYEDEGPTACAARRERLHKDLVSSSIGGKYECTTCKKSFNTHQALGGHRASHKKTKGCFARTSPSDLSGEHLLVDELELSYVQAKDPSHSTLKKKKKQRRTQQPLLKGHACSICHRIFLTGQALGGHKRCHWAGEKPCETASVASTGKTASLQSDEQSSKEVEGGIDLNMPAPRDVDDEAGYGCAELRSSCGVGNACELESTRKKDVGEWSEFSEMKGTSKWAWTVKDMLIGDTSGSLANAAMEIEAMRRFDGIWGQHWPNNNGVSIAQLPLPVCAVQSLV